MKTNAETTSKADQVKNLRERRAATKGAKASTSERRVAKKAQKAETASIRKTAKAKVRAEKPTSGNAKAVRPGSKLEIVVGLLTRKEGCTSAEILKACDWPAVSVPQQARAAGLTLRQEKDGKVTRYWGS